MAVSTITVGAGTFTIGAAGLLTNFSSQVTSIKLVPSAETGDSIPVLSGESVAGEFSETYTIEGTLLQDFGVATSKVEWLYAHSGETHVFEFDPATTGLTKITGSLVVTAVEIGGDVKTKPTADFSFTCVGKPTVVAAP
jgi:hypothetical protein